MMSGVVHVSVDARCKPSLIIPQLTFFLLEGQKTGTINLAFGFQDHDSSLYSDPSHILLFKLLTSVIFHSNVSSSFYQTMGCCTILLSYCEDTEI